MSFEIFSTIGLSCWHGPHHDADGIYTQQAVDEAMKAGDIEGAFGLAQQRKQQLSKQDKIKQFSQYR